MQSNTRIVKPSKVQGKLTYKQRQFINEYKKTGNGVQSALKAGYGNGKYQVAASSATALLKNPKVLAVLNDHVEEAELVIASLMHSDNEQIALAAAKETLDRTVGKAVQRSENVNINITVESMLNNE